jgi:hypothetical protein
MSSVRTTYSEGLETAGGLSGEEQASAGLLSCPEHSQDTAPSNSIQSVIRRSPYGGIAHLVLPSVERDRQPTGDVSMLEKIAKLSY